MHAAPPRGRGTQHRPQSHRERLPHISLAQAHGRIWDTLSSGCRGFRLSAPDPSTRQRMRTRFVVWVGDAVEVKAAVHDAHRPHLCRVQRRCVRVPRGLLHRHKLVPWQRHGHPVTGHRVERGLVRLRRLICLHSQPRVSAAPLPPLCLPDQRPRRHTQLQVRSHVASECGAAPKCCTALTCAVTSTRAGDAAMPRRETHQHAPGHRLQAQTQALLATRGTVPRGGAGRRCCAQAWQRA